MQFSPMTINFHTPANRYTYTGRQADASWHAAITSIIDPVGKQVADIGCGGGIYTRAWSQLGTSHVTALDFSAQMVQATHESTVDLPNITVQQGSATATGLDAACVDIVFERALIHHLADLTPAFQEANRILRAGGIYIIQDRTLDDVQIPGSPDHLRGYFMECFPRLLEIETQRRPAQQTVASALSATGFSSVQAQPLWETRRVYATPTELADDLRTRTGRSILHALTDAELDRLITHILAQFPPNQPITERDRWTIWRASKHP